MEFKDPDLVKIDVVPLTSIPLRDEFFDSLRVDYKEFDDWFRRVAAEGRKAWKIDTGSGQLDTLCIYKIETQGEAIDDEGSTLPGAFLKLCTLKVTKRGLRFGERLLYAAFIFALDNGLRYVYAQVRRTGHEKVVELLERFGFVRKGEYREDWTYVKDMTPGRIPLISIDPKMNFEYFRKHYPYHLDGGAVRKYFVSLDPDTHEHLFIDSRVQSLPLELHNQGLIGEVKAIRKAIVQNDVSGGLRPSDMLLFYRQSTDATTKGFVDYLGVVEKVKTYSRYEDIEADIRECLPYSDEELLKYNSRGAFQVVVFWMVHRIRPGIRRVDLSDGGYDTHHRLVKKIHESI